MAAITEPVSIFFFPSSADSNVCCFLSIRQVLDVITHIWNKGGDASLEIPPLADVALPEMPEDYETNPQARLAYNRTKANVIKTNKELHSLRCDTQYKILVARHVCAEGIFLSPPFFPRLANLS